MGALVLIVILDHVTSHQWSCDARQSLFDSIEEKAGVLSFPWKRF